MRRGRPGIAGWRNENPRYFRPRSGGNTHFRPPRDFSCYESSRFPPFNFRHNKAHSYNAGQNDPDVRSDLYDKKNFKIFRPNLGAYQYNDRHKYSSSKVRTDIDESFFFDNHNQNDQFVINSLGDIDERQIQTFHGGPFQRQSWESPEKQSNLKKRKYPHKSYRHHSVHEPIRAPPVEYTGHRPPSSDHYGRPEIGKCDSNALSRSVDDTVNKVRNRLLHRNETLLVEEQHEQNYKVSNSSKTTDNPDQHKKRVSKQRHVMKADYTKIKNKIVNQLFKMDKGKINKLMDDPSSSSKFEYAISSFITESQNSLDNHLRSAAEKSLYSSGEDFIQNDNNTIYEDTFMKQMQGVLDPQDTVLLEDIKPIILAELSKVLQLDDFTQRVQVDPDQFNNEYQNDFENHSNEVENSCDDFPKDYDEYEQEFMDIHKKFSSQESAYETSEIGNRNMLYDSQEPLFERRPLMKISEEKRSNFEKLECNNSNKNIIRNKDHESQSNPFDQNVDQYLEDDPFADLDNQYHVAVNHNFYEEDEPVVSCDSPSNTHTEGRPETPVIKEDITSKVQIYPDTINVKKEFDAQSQILPGSSLNTYANNSCDKVRTLTTIRNKCFESNQGPENDKTGTTVSQSEITNTSLDKHKIKEESAPYILNDQLKEQQSIDACPIPKEKSENAINSNSKPQIKSKSRSRSVDQRPSHRKEKRKKSETNILDSNKQILNKNIIINVNDCASKSEKCDVALSKSMAKSIFNLYFSKDNTEKPLSNDTEQHSQGEKSTMECKTKNTEKKIKDKKRIVKRKHNTNSLNHSLVPKSNAKYSNKRSKAEIKVKLKTFDMFSEQTKKVSTVYQPLRNTVSVPSTSKKHSEKKFITQVSKTNTSTKNVATQVIMQYISKGCQVQNKVLSKSIQTDPVVVKKTDSTKIDTLERMKEIDTEIQILLQEKFKLYNSLEVNDTCQSSLNALGMTVLNVESEGEEIEQNYDSISEDTIVENFTHIPMEELEQIAYGTMDCQKSDTNITTRNRKRSKSVTEKNKSATKNTKPLLTPNVSLIEQIITDERSLEDIISLEDLEGPPPKAKRKVQKSNSKRKTIKSKKKVNNTKNILRKKYDLKDCYVQLLREDLSKYLEPTVEPAESTTFVELSDKIINQQVLISTEVVEESVLDDIQFDMLDVSEDIVIGESCDIKFVDDNNFSETVSLNEDIILDNSQSSCEETTTAQITQSENQCKIFDYSSDESLKRDSALISSNGDAVLAIEPIENNFVAACLDGNVYYISGEGHVISTLRGSNLAVTCLTIVKEKYGTTVYTGSLDSRIRYYDLETGLEKGPECNVLSPIQTMDRAWDTIFVGTRTGFVLQFECKNNMLIPVSTVKFADQSILALRAMKEGPRKVLLVAARSENVTIKDAQTGLLLRTLEGPKMTVYSLLYEDGKVYCGTSTHQIHVFDYTSGTHVGTHDGGKGAVCLRAMGGLVFTGCYDGCVYVYREGESAPFAQLKGPSLMLLSLAILATKIVVGYKDRSLYIWKIPLPILQEMIL